MIVIVEHRKKTVSCVCTGEEMAGMEAAERWHRLLIVSIISGVTLMAVSLCCILVATLIPLLV